MNIRHLRGVRAAAAVATCLALVTAAAANATTGESPEQWQTLTEAGSPDPSPAALAESVSTFLIAPAERYLLEGTVASVASTEADGEEQVISLATDILFTPDNWELPPTAGAALSGVLAAVPDGATVTVAGHTDSVVGAVDNQELSLNRARAVAEAITAARADLTLTVEGFAATQPKVPESGAQEEQARAANRRVELRYAG